MFHNLLYSVCTYGYVEIRYYTNAVSAVYVVSVAVLSLIRGHFLPYRMIDGKSEARWETSFDEMIYRSRPKQRGEARRTIELYPYTPENARLEHV